MSKSSDLGLDCTFAEMTAVTLARDLANDEKAIIGTNSDIQVAACNLARRLHARLALQLALVGGASPLR